VTSGLLSVSDLLSLYTAAVGGKTQETLINLLLVLVRTRCSFSLLHSASLFVFLLRIIIKVNVDLYGASS